MNKIKKSVVDYCKEKKDLLIKLLLCILFFAFIILLTRNNKSKIEESINKLNINVGETEITEVEEDTLQSEEYYNKLLNNLALNNFDLTINIKKDKETKKVALSRENLNKEVLYLRENNIENYYYKNNEKFYKYENEKMVLSDYVNVLKYEIDLFYDMNDLVNFLNTTNSLSLNLNEKNTFYKYKVKLSEFLDLYNSINSTSFTLEEDDISIVYVYYYNEISKVVFDFTSFYNYLYHTNYKDVEYEFVFSNINKIDLTEIDNLIN